MKLNLTMLAIIMLATIAGFGVYSTYQQKAEIKALKAEKSELTQRLNEQAESLKGLFDVYVKLAQKENYSISLNPKIDTKFNSTFGSTKQVTMQYYFTMDGNAIELKPDSTILLKK